MNYKKISLFLLAFLAMGIFTQISLILDLPSELLLLMLGGVLIIDIFLSEVFLRVNQNKKMYLASVTFVLFLDSVIAYILIGSYDLIIMLLFLSLIATGLIFAILFTTEWDQRLLSKYIRAKKFQKALNYSNKMLGSNPDNYFAILTKASSLRMLGNYSDSLEICNSFLEKHPNDSYFLNLKVDALINIKQIDEAEEINNKLLSKNSKDMIALSNKGHILLERGCYQDSIHALEKSLKIMPDKEKWTLMGLKPMKIIPVPEEIAKIWLSKGLAHKNLQQYSEALESFNKALEFNPDSEEAQKNKDEVSGMING